MTDPDTPLTIAHVDAEPGWSGGQVQVFLLMEGLAARGHRNVLCCPPGSRGEAEARARGFEVRSVPMRVDGQLTAVPRLARAFRELDVDRVHLHTGRANWLGGLAAAWTRRPMLTTRRQDGRVGRHVYHRWFYRRLVSWAVAISPAIARQLADAGVPPEKIVVIPSSVDPEALTPRREAAAVRAELGIAPDAVVLLVLAGLHRRKGHDVLLEALARMQQRPRVLLAGDGPEREALARQIERLELADRVTLLGRRDDGPDLLAAADATVMPSRREGLGIAALEAMATGTPVVASAVGGLADAVVADRTGLLVPPEDPAALAAALDRITADPALRERLGREGPARVAEGFRPEQMVEAYARLYRRMPAS